MRTTHGHRKFGRKRQAVAAAPVLPASARPTQRTETLEQLFAKSPVLQPHLTKFIAAEIDADLALRLTEAHLAEILEGSSLGERIRVHAELGQLDVPPAPSAGCEDEKFHQMLRHGSWNTPAVQHVIGILDTEIVVAALFLTIAAAALVAAPGDCRDWDDSTC